MSAVPTAKGRRIDDILLELGFASDEALAKARIEHEKTGQPLGTILVEQGAITRLELASALAEQWSDQSASIKLLPIPPAIPGPRRVPEPHDDDQYAARLQDAVAELAQRVGATQPTEEFDDRVTDLAERVEATVARIQRIEATLATLAESFEGVTGGVEEAFGALQSGMAGLALDLARIDTTVAELAAHPSDASGPDHHDLAARLEELGTAVAALADRPVVDPDVESRLDALAARVENAVAPDEVGALRHSLVAYEQRLSALAEDADATEALDQQAHSLAELRSAVSELESRPVGDPELDERLARLETQFADRLAAKPDASEIEALAERLEVRANEHEDLATAVAQLGVRIDEMTWRDEGATSIDELQARIESFAATLADVRHGLTTQEEVGAAQRLDELGLSFAALRDEVATVFQSLPQADRIEQIDRRIEDLTAERDAQQALTARLDELERRLTSDAVTAEDLSRALADARDELTPAPAPLADPRIDEMTRELAALRDDRAPDPRLDQLAADIADLRSRLADSTLAPEPDIEIAAEFASLRQELAELRHTRAPADDPEIRAEIDALARRIEEATAAESHDDAPLVAKLEALEQRLEVPAPADPRVEHLVQDIDAIRSELARAELTTAPDPVVASELDTLSARLRLMEGRVEGDMATGIELTRAIEALRAELAGTDTPIVMDTSELESTIEALVGRVDGLADAVTSGTAGTAGPAIEEIQRLVDDRVEAKVAQRVAELTRGFEERLATAEAHGQSGRTRTGDAAALEELLESNRMTIERLGLHLGEHDRALAELMRSRNLPQKLDELAARIDEIAVGAPPAGAAPVPGTRREIGSFGAGESVGEVKALMRRVEDAEVASQADREKLMNRLERMASSIDWRLQRLESTEGQE